MGRELVIARRDASNPNLTNSQLTGALAAAQSSIGIERARNRCPLITSEISE
jgi:hypothetical protein